MAVGRALRAPVAGGVGRDLGGRAQMARDLVEQQRRVYARRLLAFGRQPLVLHVRETEQTGARQSECHEQLEQAVAGGRRGRAVTTGSF